MGLNLTWNHGYLLVITRDATAARNMALVVCETIQNLRRLPDPLPSWKNPWKSWNIVDVLRVSVWSRICTPIAFRSCTGIAISEDFDFGILNCMENISQSRWYLLQLPAVYSKSRSKEDSSINKHISWYHQSVTNSPVTPLAPKIIVYQLPRRSQRASGRRVALGLQEWFLSGDIAPDDHLEKWWIKLLGWLGVYFQTNCLDGLGAKATKVRREITWHTWQRHSPVVGRGAVSKSTSRKIPKKTYKIHLLLQGLCFPTSVSFWGT